MRGSEARRGRSNEEPVRIPANGVNVYGDLAVPDAPAGIVAFAHGSGSGRFSRRNRAVAAVLQEAGFATLLMDLLTQEEEAAEAATGHLRFDIPFLARRLLAASSWLRDDARLRALPLGYFGASTGAAAALAAAAERPDDTQAVVSRGGRPDLARDALARVRAPTLLIVGGADHPVVELNESARAQLRTQSELAVVPGATHLFEEAGALEEVARLARDWFARHLAAVRGS